MNVICIYVGHFRFKMSAIRHAWVWNIIFLYLHVSPNIYK